MTPWAWHVGDEDSVSEGVYDLDECETRNAAIDAGLRETIPGEILVIVEARSSTDRRYECADVIPFVKWRNRCTFRHLPGWLALLVSEG